jgi:hypothetical protein
MIDVCIEDDVCRQLSGRGKWGDCKYGNRGEVKQAGAEELHRWMEALLES